MADDSAIDDTIWNGEIPVHFTREDRPDELYMILARQVYFPFAYTTIMSHFKLKEEGIDLEDIWLSDDQDRHLKWTVPIGVLYDMYADKALPWKITVHVRNHPRELIPLRSMTQAKQYLFNRIKEADHLRHKSPQQSGFNSLDPEARENYWTGIRQGDRGLINGPLRQMLHLSGSSFFCDFPFVAYIMAEGNGPPRLQEIIKDRLGVIDEQGFQRTLGDLIKFLSGSEGLYQVVMHGVDVPLETPLQWLATHLIHADHFCHVILFPLEAEA